MRPIAVGSGGALLEREQELRALDEAIEGLDAGDGAVVLLEGVAGAGKSRLLDAAQESAAESGVRVLSARSSELETGFSFGVVLQLFEPPLTGMTRHERHRALSGSAHSAAWLFDGVEGTPVDASGDALFRTLHGLYWLTVALTSGRPLLILVDDAHWCDEASLRFLGYLARRLEGLPVALIVALRDGDGHRRLAALSELSSNLRSQRLRPSPLSPDAVELLVRERVSSDAEPGFCSRCAEITGGNPFLVHELLSEIKRDGLPADAAGAKRVSGLVPESVLRAVIARIAGLPEGSAQLVRAAAVLGESATLQRCALLAGIAPEAADRAVDALVTAGVFDGGSQVKFAHPLLASTVESEISGAARARAHQRAAEILHDDGERDEVVAAHLLVGSSGAGEPWVVETLRAAARSALAGCEPARAVALLERARAEGPHREIRGEILRELGQAQALAADPHALETLEEALASARDPDARTALYRRRGDLLFAQHRPDDAVAEYNRGLSELDPESPAARELMAARAVAMAVAPGGIEAALADVATIVERVGVDTPAERLLLAQVALRMALTGEPRDQTRVLALRAWADGALLEAEGPEGHLWSLVTGALSFGGFFTEAIAIIDCVIGAAQRVGSVFAFATASYSRAGPLYWHGRIPQATDDAQRALAARADGWSAWIGSNSFTLCRCFIEQGDLDQAELLLEDPDDPRWAQSLEGLTVLEGRAWLNLARGRNEQALTDYLALGERCEGAFGVSSPVIMPWHSGAALAALRLGKIAQATELNSAGTQLAERFGAPGPIGRSRCIAGLIAGGNEGLALMQEAVDLLAGTEAELEYLYALVELGSALRRANRRSSARVPLAAAQELAQTLGATALQARASEQLRATGARPRRIMRSGVDSLTPSERRIADHAAAGLTNRQIAEMLFITTKAVEFHLANTYRKLDIRRRRELVTALSAPSEGYA